MMPSSASTLHDLSIALNVSLDVPAKAARSSNPEDVEFRKRASISNRTGNCQA